MKNKVIILIVAMVAMMMSAIAQNFPFPQHVTYGAGIKPNNVSQATMDNTVSNYWNLYKARYVKSAGGSPTRYYIAYNADGGGDTGASTVSEAHGYGMVFEAYFGDKTHFDGMYWYYKDHPSQNNSWLMAWQQNTSFQDINGADSATDGDMDIAYALLLADKQWGSAGTINYKHEATNMINALMQSDVNQSQWTLRLGDWATTGTSQGFAYSTSTRPSDFMLDHCQSYYEATGDGRWTNVYNKIITIINQIFNNNSPGTGLVCDFVVLNGSTYQPAPANFLEGSTDPQYGYNSCRTPWRFPTDYLLRGGNPGHLKEMRRMNGWIKNKSGGNASNIFPGYTLSGTALDTSYTDSSFTSPFGVCAMTDSTNQTWLNTLWTWNAGRGVGADDAYFGNSIKIMSMLVMAGNWWKPIYNAPPPPDFTLSSTPASSTVVSGGSTSYTSTVTAVNGFNSSVSFSVTGVPGGATASFSPTSVTGSGSTTLTVNSGSAAAGSYTLLIKGTSGSLVHSNSVTLVISDFNVTLTPTSNTVTQGDSASYTVTIGSVNGFNGSVDLTAAGLPANANGNFSATPVTAPGTSTLTIDTTTNTATGTATITVTGTSGTLSHSDSSTLTVNPAQSGGALPAGWTDADIGAVGVAGSASYDSASSTFTLNGSGNDIWSTADAFNYASESDTGDITVVARVLTVENTSGWAKAGVMVRESTAAGAAYVGLYVTPSNGVSMQFRPATGATAIDLGRQAGPTAPYWVKLVRSGNTFTGFSSTDGNTWTQVAATNVTMASGVLAGLADCAHANTTLCTATYDNVSVTAGNPPPPQQYFEAEGVAYVTNGATATLNTDTNASGGQWILFNGTASGQYIEYTLPNVPAGTYDLTLLYKQNTTRGIVSLTVDDVKLDSDLDQYGASSYTQKDFGLITFTATGNHTVRLTLTGKNASSTGFTVSADAFQLAPVSQSWLDADIGAVGLAGSFSQSSGTYTIAGSGSDIWTTGDQFHYAWQNVSGDVDVVARVASEQQTSSFAKAGVMIRESLATNSIEASVLLTPTNGVALEVRPTTGAATINVSGWVKGPVAPQYVKLSRVGSTFTASYSADGATWTSLASTNVTMHVGATAGMAVTAHNNAALNTATFDNVSLQ